MKDRGKLEMALEEGIDLIHEVMLVPEIPEDLRLKLLAWRSKADNLIDE